MKVDFLKIAVILIYALGITVTAIALFTNYWILVSVPFLGINFHRGLLQWVCIQKFNYNCFTKFPFFPGWLKSVFLCMCVSLGLQIVISVASVFTFFIKSKNAKLRLTIVCAFISFASFVLLSVAIGIFAGKSNVYYFGLTYKGVKVTVDLGWSYWMAIIAVFFTFVTTILEGVQAFKIMKNYKIDYPYPPEAITTWKFTM
ncbi:unnamed protein product [Caenorhabditis angaria]|uniref:Uncharacterized protein n=1 Tax=Caenorhabditis angaria TaxID=860376 RepID=A0A9P1J825_9PELO|nr:unnamed protein product [Caenorhabditis angaria]